MQNSYNDSVYPRHDIDPALKNAEWCRLYAKAVWHDWEYVYPRTVFYNSADKYEELRLYAIGKQPITPYKKLMGVDEQTNNTWLNIDWSVRPIIPKLRDIAIARCMQQTYDIVATPIDLTAKTELSKYYAEQKAKIAMRQLAQQTNPEMAQHPMLMQQQGEPADTEELEMRIDFGEQFNRAKDAEMASKLALYEGDEKLFRKKMFEDQFDIGVSGYKQWLGKDNRPKYREANPECVISSYCRKKDFSDAVHMGEVIDVSVVDLATMKDEQGNQVFTEDQVHNVIEQVAGRWNNPVFMGRYTNYYKGYDKFRCKVLDLRFYSYNDYNYEDNINRKGNPMFNEAAYNKKNYVKNKYVRKKVQVVYEVKWIIGTDLVYDWGLAKDMPRSVETKNKAYTPLGYRFFAPNFYEMRALGMMERLKPLADDYQLTVYRIQNFINRMVPNGWWTDLDALENVALNKGGKNMTPRELIDMFFETGILVGRSKDVMGDNVNYKPIVPIPNNNYDQLQALYQHMEFVLNQLQSMIGLNDLTDGSTPNPKTLNGVANIAVESTNNALHPMQFAERWLLEHLSQDLLLRMQQAVKKGNIEGFAPALNGNTLQFMQISPEIALRDYGIMLDERPTDDQRQLLMMQMQQDIAQGLLDTSDVIYVMNMYNVKQAQMMLSYKVKKNKQAMQQNEMQKIQQTIQGQQQSAQFTEQMKQQTIQLQSQLNLQEIDRQGMWDLEREKIKLTVQQAITEHTNQTHIAGKVIDAETKKQVAEMKPAPASK